MNVLDLTPYWPSQPEALAILADAHEGGLIGYDVNVLALIAAARWEQVTGNNAMAEQFDAALLPGGRYWHYASGTFVDNLPTS